MFKYNNITEVFDLLNHNNISYLVLRNYENLLEPEMYIDGHGDVDLLCADSQEIVRVLDAQTNRKDQWPYRGDGIHYYIFVAGERVSLDLRYVGDDYYCKEWEEYLLRNRIVHNGFYVMDEKSYFFTLIYHAILQKPYLAEEYLSRLSIMAEKLGIVLSNYSEISFIAILNTYMRENGYCYTYPVDYIVPVRFHLVDQNLVKMNHKRWFRHKHYMSIIKTIEILVWLKHKLQGRR